MFEEVGLELSNKRNLKKSLHVVQYTRMEEMGEIILIEQHAATKMTRFLHAIRLGSQFSCWLSILWRLIVCIRDGWNPV